MVITGVVTFVPVYTITVSLCFDLLCLYFLNVSRAAAVSISIKTEIAPSGIAMITPMCT